MGERESEAARAARMMKKARNTRKSSVPKASETGRVSGGPEPLLRKSGSHGVAPKPPRTPALIVQTPAAKVPQSRTQRKKLPRLQRGHIIRNEKNHEACFSVVGPWRNSSPWYYTACPGDSTTHYPSCFIIVEPLAEDDYPKQLKREATILREAAKYGQPEHRSHFLRILGRGRVKDLNFSYLVLPFCEFSLDNALHSFTPSDTVRFALQSFQAVHDLHLLGFIHRNLRPSSFVLQESGVADTEWKLYLSCFGYAYRYIRRDGRESRAPKTLFRMKRVKFLPRNYHYVKDLSRRDDLESWVFTVTHLMDPSCLNWKDDQVDLQVLSAKERFFCLESDAPVMLYLPKDMHSIIKYVHRLESDNRPDYAFVGLLLAEIARSFPCKLSGPLDCQRKRFGEPHAWTKLLRKNSAGCLSGEEERGRSGKHKSAVSPRTLLGSFPSSGHKFASVSSELLPERDRNDTFESEEDEPRPRAAPLPQGASKKHKRPRKSCTKIYDTHNSAAPELVPLSKEKLESHKKKQSTPRAPKSKTRPTQNNSHTRADTPPQPPSPSAERIESTLTNVTTTDFTVRGDTTEEEEEEEPAGTVDKPGAAPDSNDDSSMSTTNSSHPPPAIFTANKVPKPANEDPKEEI